MTTLRNNKHPWVLYGSEVPHRRIWDPDCGASPAEKLSPRHLQLLTNEFIRAGEQKQEERRRRRTGKKAGGNEERGMNMEEFQEVLRSVIGPDIEDSWMEGFFIEREPTVRVVTVSHPPPRRYIGVSKGGQISVGSSGLHISKSFGLAGDPAEEVTYTKRFRAWTSDAVYMGSIHEVAIATNCKDLHFLNVSTDLGKHSKVVSYRHIPSIHREPINRVMFDSGANIIMTSSESDTTSVVCMNAALEQESYIWRFKQGAKCFDYNAPLQLMVTGGSGHAVRLWTRFVTTRPVATLLGHSSCVLDLVIYQPVEQIFSYSRDYELRIWDIPSHYCLKTISLHFPCQQLGRIPEHGNFPLLLLSPPLSEQTHLVVGCKDYLARLHLAEDGRGRGGGWLMNDARGPGPNIESGPALSCALYNSTLRQVVAGHSDSSVSLWDVETGRKRLQILNAHGEDEITCMTLDSSHRHLITGGRSGTIKVWNLLNGLNVHQLEPVAFSEVTALTCLPDNQLLAVGWSQRIAQYDIASAKDLYVRADMTWKTRGVHKSDILAVSQCAALGVVATASRDGEVIIWRLETQGPVLRLQGPAQRGVEPAVDALLFLQHRAGSRKLRGRGVLVSSQAGCLCFWSISRQTHTYCQFYAPEQPGDRVLSLSSDQAENAILVSGDTAGWLYIWDISCFALDILQQSVCDRPPLLQSWKVHERALGSVEVVEVSERWLILTASTDGFARLWTNDGDPVGSFGQEVMWNIADPATYQK